MKIQYFEQLVKPFDLSELKYLVSNKNYTHLYFSTGIQKISSYTLLNFEKHLKNNLLFERIHRSYIINTNFIDTINLGDGFLKLSNGIVVPISSLYTHKLKSKLK